MNTRAVAKVLLSREEVAKGERRVVCFEAKQPRHGAKRPGSGKPLTKLERILQAAARWHAV
jgi:hypothetical protein